MPRPGRFVLSYALVGSLVVTSHAAAQRTAAQSAPAPSSPAQGTLAQSTPAEYERVLVTLGKKGDYKDGVLKVNLPRNDLTVTIKGTPAPTPFGFGGWVALTRGEHDMSVLMGDLVLTEDEVNPVMSALLENGFDVTALHNHFFWETPRVFYMHVHGHGQPATLASKLKPALDLIGKAALAPAPAAAALAAVPAGSASPGAAGAPGAPATTLDTAALARIVGHEGEQSGPVYKITIGRSDFVMKEMGAVINARMGLNTWAAFVGTKDQAMVAGDVAMLDTEVTPVLKALRANGLDVVAIHHHMTGTAPVVIFLHYWGQGPAEQLAHGVRAAIDVLGKSGRPVAP